MVMDLLRFSLPNRYPSQCSPDSSSSLDGSRGGHGNPWLVSYPSPSHVSLNSNRNWATAATASAKEGLSRWLTAWRVKTRNIFLKERTLAHWILQLTKLQNRFIFCHAPRTDLILTWLQLELNLCCGIYEVSISSLSFLCYPSSPSSLESLPSPATMRSRKCVLAKKHPRPLLQLPPLDQSSFTLLLERFYQLTIGVRLIANKSLEFAPFCSFQ